MTTKISKDERSSFKEWLYEYFRSDEKQKRKMKKDNSFSYSAIFSTVVEMLPVSGETNISYNSEKNNEEFFKKEEEYQKNKYLTDEQTNSLIANYMNENQLMGYIACLELCKGYLGRGISYTIQGDVEDVFILQVKYDSQVGGHTISLKEDAEYNNLEPVRALKFKSGLLIKDRQSIGQTFKRLDRSKSASFSFNVNEGIEISGIEFPKVSLSNQNNMPVGTIIASVLPYKSFLEANMLLATTDMSIALWIPCDGRDIGAISEYSKFGGKVPDLRGVFLRGINSYDSHFNGVGRVSAERANPEDKGGGEFQTDQIKNHTHKISQSRNVLVYQEGGNLKGGVNAPFISAIANPLKGNAALLYTDNDGGNEETRPKNVTVYYYLKINP